MIRRNATPWWAEPPLVAVSIATVAGFVRVYDGWGFFGPLLAFALGAHALAIACRRLRLPVPAVIVLAVAGAAVATGLILFPSTTSLGLPTTATWQASRAALHTAREQYPVVVAPAETLPGFQLAAGLALWLAAWFGDWAAHRLRAIAEAVAATTAIFVFCSVLGSGAGEVACATAFAAAVLWFVAVQRSVALDRDQAWLPGGRATTRALLRSAGAIALVALVAGALVGPTLPGARSEAALDWRDGGTGDRSRVTVSPMVEIRKRLVDQSNREVFRVRASEPAYWRLTSLDSFDGEIWSSSGEFKQAGDELPTSAVTGQEFRPVRQEVTIRALSAIWAPTAFEAVSVAATETPLRWDPDSSTLIVDSSEPTSDGLTYTVVSRVPRFGAEQLDAARGTDPAAIRERYLGLPVDFPFAASDAARTVTATADSRYDQALALQDWFRQEFSYSLEPDDGHGDQAIEAFLASRQGYCEQFAGTFAAMARSLGIPARVAVGFTPGIADPDDPGLYRVYGRHAHAWPEVYFPDTGWVAFEPTPDRGMPGAEGYTGVAPQQDLTPPAPVTTTTAAVASTTAAPAGGTPTTERPRTDRTETDAGEATPAVRRSPGRAWRVAGLAALAIAAVAAAVLVGHRRRRASVRAARSPADQTWRRVSDRLAAKAGLRLDPAETPFELVERARPAVGDAVAEELRSLAALVTEARWSPAGLAPADAHHLEPLAASVTEALDHLEPVPASPRGDQDRSLSDSSSASPSSWWRRRLRTRSPVSPK